MSADKPSLSAVASPSLAGRSPGRTAIQGSLPFSGSLHGIGTDLLRIDRVERVWRRHGARFVERILMPEERARLPADARAGRYLAKHFAVKEAFVKALGTGFRDGVTHHDAGYVQADNGRPSLIVSAAMQARFDALGIAGGQVSLSDDDGRVLAFVVLERAAVK